MNPKIVTVRDGKPGERVTVYKAHFEDGFEAILQVDVDTDHYEQNSRIGVRILEPTGAWSKPIVWLTGKQCHAYGIAADLMAGRLTHTMDVMREEGHEKPYDVLLKRAVDEDDEIALADAVEILMAAHGPLS